MKNGGKTARTLVALSEIASPESGGDADGWFYYLFNGDSFRASQAKTSE